jgi:hypothetical protein
MKRITNKYLAKAIILGVGVLSAASLTASAQVLFTTQNDFSSWTFTAGTASVGTIGDTDFSTVNGLGNTVAPGGTGTAGALTVNGIPVSGWNPIQSQNEQGNAAFIAALDSASTLSITYTLASSITTGSGGYWQIVPVFNSSAGYAQLHNDAFFSVANGTLSAGTYTVTYNITGAPSGTLSYFQLLLVMNTGGTGLAGGYGEVSIDNITLNPVPEPSTLALAGLGAAALLIFRRRK